MKTLHRAGAAALLLALLAAPSSAGDYEKLAAALAGSARTHGRIRLAILPFVSIGGKGSTSGRIVSERLVGPLTNEKAIEVVERALLESVMNEQRLQVSGIADSRSVKELGKIFNADAIVTGTVMSLKDDRVEIIAHLIDAETAKVIGVASAKVEQDWSESLFDDSSWISMSVPSLPSFDLASPAMAGDWGCGRAQETVDELERSLVDLKARFWAQKIREGLNGASLKRNPGSEIHNPEIRAKFYERLRERHAAADSGLNEHEKSQMKDMMEKVSKLNKICSAEGA